ncbi:hypothetical protein, unknown function [Leishmania tarentolae]|uniref:Uncharacterized protein n=1 Tax=Leishmania tarentolae TaxID=5689 RepID=A0A640KMF0_LEITA|nr:hypothetical protein, unknown function [Leishmania tarentolae]
MLCIRKLALIDRAESGTVWSYNVKKQWYYGDSVAVRVHDSNGKVLGSTIPDVFAPTSEAGPTTACVSWINEYSVEESMAPEIAPEESPGKSSVGDSRGEAVIDGSGLSAHTVSPVTLGSTMNGFGNLNTPPGGVAAGAKHSESCSASNLPQSEFPAGSAAESDQNGTSDEPTAAPPKTEMKAAEDLSVLPTSLAVAPGFPLSEAPTGEREGASCVLVSAASVARKPICTHCTPISIAQAPNGVLYFQVITVFGTNVAVGEVSLQSLLEMDTSELPHVRHYAVLMTPVNTHAGSASTIHAVLEFSVVVGTTDIATVVSLATSASYAPMSTPLRAGSTCAFSTHTFYFPSRFLAGNGAYIMTNVLCVESLSDNSVHLEIAVPEDLKRMHVLPEKKAVLKKQGERAYFTCTWDVLSPYVDTANAKDSKRTSAELHVLIRDGAESRPPVPIELVGDLPPTEAESMGPYMFFVNHAKFTNNCCSAGDEAILRDILPISLITRAVA